MDIPDWIGYVGLGSFIMGFALFILSHGKMKGFEDKGKLVTEGIYSKIRNPMYLGFIIWIVGFPIFTRSLITLLSSVIWISFILTWKRLEEKELEKKYENYREYKKRTLF
jgi:protein-S-isoprenylcysteine O-methyltransferase Ste14